MHLKKLMRVMRLTLVFMLAISLQLSAKSDGQMVTLSVKNAPVKKVFKEIQRQTGLNIFIEEGLLNSTGKISLNVKSMPVTQVLKMCLGKDPAEMIIEAGAIVVKSKPIMPVVQPTAVSPPEPVVVNKEIKGLVSDEKGNPIGRATVILKPLKRETMTADNGVFTLANVPEGTYTLEVSYVGYEKYVTRVVVNAAPVSIQLSMRPVDNSLSDVSVVSTGYQTIKKERNTGSVGIISSKDIQESGVISMEQVLRGKLAGVTALNVSGRPGETSQIRIRGLNSITGSLNPIWIVDGLELQGGVPSVRVGATNFQTSIFTNGIGNILPEDIKTITVLKDAAASAIYGARAANGVIVVETKRGTAGESRINFSSSFSVSEAPVNHLDMMSALEKIEYEKGIYEDFGGFDIKGRVFQLKRNQALGRISNADVDAEIAALSKNNTDWFGVIFRPAVSNRHTVTFSGGTPKLQYYTSANVTTEAGILKGNNLTNIGLSATLNFKPIKKLSIDLTIRSNIRKDRVPDPVEDPFRYATFANKYEKPFNEDGSYAFDRSFNAEINPFTNQFKFDYNILADMESAYRKSRASATTLSTRITYDILKSLAFETQTTFTYSSNNSEEIAAPGSFASYRRSVLRSSGNQSDDLPLSFNNGYLRERNGSNDVIAWRNLLRYAAQLRSKHFVNLMAGQEISHSKTSNFFNLLPEYNPDYQAGGYTPTPPVGVTYANYQFGLLGGSARDISKNSSFFANGSYSYGEKYIVGASVRYDGVDIVGNQNQFSPLWNASLRWNLHRERFIEKNFPFIDLLSVRYSYGYTGSIDRNALPFSYLNYGSINYYDNTLLPTTLNWRNPNIKWQTKLDRNLGFDFSILKGKISGEFNFYDNRIDDLLDDQFLPVSSGISRIRANVASVANRGIELTLNGVVYDSKDFRWTVSFNMAKNESNVIKTFYDNIESIPELSRFNPAFFRKLYVKGYDVSAWFGYQFAGVDPITGNTLAYVNNTSEAKSWQIHSTANDGRMIIDMDRNYNHKATVAYIGNQYPPTVGGFGTTLRYKSLSLATQFSYVMGNLIKNPRSYSSTDYFSTNVNRLRSDLNRWRQPGDITDVPQFRSSQNNYAYNNYFFDNELEKGDFLKLTYINIAWDLRGGLVKKLGLQRSRIGLNAQNLFTWTKYRGLDPENNGAFQYPSPRRYTLTLDVNF